MATSYDVVVIGAGTGGYVAAIRCAQLGKKVAVVEKQKALGGTCLIWGCIPTKALLEHAHALKVIRDAKEWGVTIPAATPVVDMNQVNARKDRIVNGLTRGVEFLFKKNKIDWIKGTARLAGKGTVEITDGDRQTLDAKEIIIATGSSARSVPGIEIDHRRIITSDDAIGLKEIQKTLVIMGSGAVGVEFASIYRRFGSEVTIIELLPRLVPLEDEAISTELEKSFRKQGIKSLTATRVTRASAGPTGVEIEAQTPDGKTQKLTAELLLVATGRGPVTSGLGAEEAGIKLERGYVKVDELYRTSVANVSAIGDVITLGDRPHPQLAHVSSAEGILVAERLAGQDVRPLNYDHVPNCTYCDPEIGSVGLTEAEAREKGYDVRVGSFPFGVLGRAKMAGETEGFVKIVADKKYDEILGVHMIGPRSTELVAEAVLALRLECTVEELVKTIHAHPTFSEAIGEAAHATHGAPIHFVGALNFLKPKPVARSQRMPTPVVMPQMGESIAEGTIVRWIKKVGESVERDEPLFEISTDKVDAEIPSPAAGVLTDIKVQEGETVAVNSVVAEIGQANEVREARGVAAEAAPPTTAKQQPDGQSTPAPTPADKTAAGVPAEQPSENGRRRSSPLVRRIAKEHNVDIGQIAGSGIGGRVTKHDIIGYIERGVERLPQTRTPGAGEPPMAEPARAARPVQVRPTGADRIEKLSVMRKKIAEHMVLSKRTSAHVHSVFHVNFSTIEKLRQQKRAEYEQAGVKLTYMAFIARVVVEALHRHPILNAAIDGDNVVYKKDINLGIAVALDEGLIVPVIRNADEKNVLGLSRAIADVADRARAKRLNPDEVHGGTFTITNPGQFGAQFGMPIINQPQVAILGVGTIEKRPVVIDDAIGIRTMAYLTLGYDHRLVDGAVADEFMADVKQHLECFDASDC